VKERFNSIEITIPFYVILDKTEVKYIEGQVVEEGTIVSGYKKETKHLAASLIS
jgi:hypothetical protein